MMERPMSTPLSGENACSLKVALRFAMMPTQIRSTKRSSRFNCFGIPPSDLSSASLASLWLLVLLISLVGVLDPFSLEFSEDAYCKARGRLMIWACLKARLSIGISSISVNFRPDCEIKRDCEGSDVSSGFESRVASRLNSTRLMRGFLEGCCGIVGPDIVQRHQKHADV